MLCIMASLKQIIYYLGESTVSLSSRELASKLSPIDLNKETKSVYKIIYAYKQFFSSEVISPNPNVGKKYSLTKNGIRFYERLLHTYDPITDTQILPQDIGIEYIQVK